MPEGGLVAARAASYAALLLTAGVPLYLLTAGRAIALTPRLRIALAVLAASAAGTTLWWALASVAAMMAQPLSALDVATVRAVLEATPLGKVAAIRLAALAAILMVAAVFPHRWLIGLLGAVALAGLAWTGHAGASEGTVGSLHRLADVAHLIAAATWLGALAVLLTTALYCRDTSELERLLKGFATTGTVIVLVLLLSGIGNTLAIAGWPLPVDSTWSVVLGLKLMMFAVMLGLAGLNRWLLTPSLADGGPQARSRLRISLLAETATALVIVMLVAFLGVLDPAALSG